MEQKYVDKLKRWIEVDNSITRIKDQLSKLVEEKKGLEEEVLSYVEEQGLSGVSVNTSDGKLQFPTRKVHHSITGKYLKSMLIKYNSEKEQMIDVDDVCNYLISNLEIKEKTYIKRQYQDG